MFAVNERKERTVQFQRHLGIYGGKVFGPLVICTGGMHGNEPFGVLALQNVLRHLQEHHLPFKGKFVALAGNVGALNLSQRFIDFDLNRMWTPARVRELKTGILDEVETAESKEQQELLEEIDSQLAGKFSEAVFLDLHTTSSAGAPFCLISDTLANRSYAQALGTPVILGLEESIEGTLLNYINELGHSALGFEAGQHNSPSALKNHESAIWITLVTAGCLSRHSVPHWRAQCRTLSEARHSLPPVFEVRYRHAIKPDDGFVMKPGYSNFQEVARGTLLATERKGEIHAPERSWLFMPLYQTQGDDGFFLIRPVRPLWLKIAAGLRRLGLDRSLAWWPGVNRVKGDEDSLVIDRHIARWFVIEICHLLGYRKHAKIGSKLVVIRRRQNT